MHGLDLSAIVTAQGQVAAAFAHGQVLAAHHALTAQLVSAGGGHVRVMQTALGDTSKLNALLIHILKLAALGVAISVAWYTLAGNHSKALRGFAGLLLVAATFWASGQLGAVGAYLASQFGG